MDQIQPCSIGVDKSLVDVIENDDDAETEDDGKQVFGDVGADNADVDENRGNNEYVKQLYDLTFSHCIIYNKMNTFSFANTIYQQRFDAKITKLTEKYETQIEKMNDELAECKEMLASKSSKHKDMSPKSISYSQYKRKIEKGGENSPLSFGGGSKTAKQRRYRNVEHFNHGKGRHTTRRVHIVGGKGHKSVTTHKGTAKKALSKEEIEKICKREFIPGLFDDCTAKHAEQMKQVKHTK